MREPSNIADVLDLLDAIASTRQSEVSQPHPPYNIRRVGPETNILEIVLPGYAIEDLEVTVGEDLLIVATTDDLITDDNKAEFNMSFGILDYVECRSVVLNAGLLRIELVRNVPVEKQVRTIQITGPVATERLEELPAEEQVA